jgi:mono/diheme cytochrome c family protein
MMRNGSMATVILVAAAAAAISIAATGDQKVADEMFDGAYWFHRCCADCHGPMGEGVSLFGVPLAGDAFVTASPADAIGYTITHGRKYQQMVYPAYAGMPKFQFITGGQLESLIDYLKGPIQASAKK